MDRERVIVILAGHGQPPIGYPGGKVMEYVRLGRCLESGNLEERTRFQELDRELRNYPRTRENDPYWFHMKRLADEVKERAGFMSVEPAHNEFCGPSIEDAIEKAAASNPDAVVVVPTMIVRGGEHSEEDIPRKVRMAARKHRQCAIIYAWPFDLGDWAELLVRQAGRFIAANPLPERTRGERDPHSRR